MILAQVECMDLALTSIKTSDRLFRIMLLFAFSLSRSRRMSYLPCGRMGLGVLKGAD
jgi:hypothetical protein